MRAADPTAKAVVFSSWGRLLRLVGEALAANGVRHASLAGANPAQREAALHAFLHDPDCAVLTVGRAAQRPRGAPQSPPTNCRPCLPAPACSRSPASSPLEPPRPPPPPSHTPHAPTGGDEHSGRRRGADAHSRHHRHSAGAVAEPWAGGAGGGAHLAPGCVPQRGAPCAGSVHAARRTPPTRCGPLCAGSAILPYAVCANPLLSPCLPLPCRPGQAHPRGPLPGQEHRGGAGGAGRQRPAAPLVATPAAAVLAQPHPLCSAHIGRRPPMVPTCAPVLHRNLLVSLPRHRCWTFSDASWRAARWRAPAGAQQQQQQQGPRPATVPPARVQQAMAVLAMRRRPPRWRMWMRACCSRCGRPSSEASEVNRL